MVINWGMCLLCDRELLKTAGCVSWGTLLSRDRELLKIAGCVSWGTCLSSDRVAAEDCRLWLAGVFVHHVRE